MAVHTLPAISVIVLRNANFSRDSALLLEWRNDPETRANSVNTGALQREAHEEWLRRTLSDPSRRVFIAELLGKPVGAVRLDSREDFTELSWMVAPEARGKGIGKGMVNAAIRLLSGKVTARIKASNAPSIKIAVDAGFVKEREEDGLTYWRLSPKSDVSLISPDPSLGKRGTL
ncbi:MAG: GNAT family N-acetyltransferase [Deltaproteobacteria bacterium]|nr:GNAT family N-acetyltransferase [Deltaproteobacteria bacterium]